MSAAREQILARIRVALADRPAPPPAPREYHPAGYRPPDVDLFVARVTEYRATVTRCGPGQVAATIDSLLARRASARAVLPDGFPEPWLPGRAQLRDEQLSAAELDAVDAVVTTCALAIASTGTIVLDHRAGQGRRALTLVPDHHIVVVRSAQLCADVPDAIAELSSRSRDTPLTWISGPSATSDIEFSRVEGVHGPRTLDVIVC